MSKYGGTISLGPRSNSELDAVVASFESCGFKLPADITVGSIIEGVGEPFLPGELPPHQYINDIGPASKQYFGQEVRPAVKKMLGENDSRAHQLGFALGRLIASSFKGGRLGHGDEPIAIMSSAVEAYGTSVPVELGDRSKYVVDYGMGMIGLFTHIKNVKNGLYNAIAIQKGPGEVVAMAGITDHFGVDSEQFALLHGGLQSGTERLLGAGYENCAQLILASRVHMAGQDLRVGLRTAPRLLAPNGVLFARGPRRYDQGMGYDEVRNLVKNNATMKVVVDQEFARRHAGGGMV